MTVTIYHNPDCGTSRNVLAIIRAAGIEPVVIEYLETGWKRRPLQLLLSAAGLTPRDALRTTRSPAQELGLLDPSVSDADLLEAMLTHPILVNRPIVSTPKGTRMCRPSEAVLGLLDQLPAGPFSKEDGTLLIDAKGNYIA